MPAEIGPSFLTRASGRRDPSTARSVRAIRPALVRSRCHNRVAVSDFDRMGFGRTAAGLLLLLFCPLLARPLAAESGPMETRYGTVEVESAEDGLTHSISVDGSAVFQYEGHAVSLEAYLSSKTRDWVLAELQSGGIACPFQYRLIELRKGHAPVVSEEFGSCGSWDTSDVRGEAVIVRILGYA